MIGSVNVPFPSNMTRRLPRRGIDDPRCALTALTGDPWGSETACRRCNRRPVSQVWDAALLFLGSPGGHKIPHNAHSGGFTLPNMAQRTDLVQWVSWVEWWKHSVVTRFYLPSPPASLEMQPPKIYHLGLMIGVQFYHLLDCFNHTFNFSHSCVYFSSVVMRSSGRNGLGCPLLVTTHTCLSPKLHQEKSACSWYSTSSFDSVQT